MTLFYAFAVLLAAPPLIGYGEYGVGKHGFSCTVKWAKNDENSTIYITILFVFGFFFPLVGTAVMYCRIVGVIGLIEGQFSSAKLAGKWAKIYRNTLVVIL